MANAPVNIVYPINGATYPLIDPGPGALNSAYVSISFSLTCGGGRHEVEWGVDGDIWGKAMFYDMFAHDQVVKVAGGKHTFWVRASCGEDEVAFLVGS